MVYRKYVALSLFFLVVASCTVFGVWWIWKDLYIIDSPFGLVVDKVSGKPLEGVNVFAVWQMEGGLGLSTQSANPLFVAEAETDRNGRFQIEVPLFVGYHSNLFGARLSGPQPVVFFLVEDYVPAAYSNKDALHTKSILGKEAVVVPVSLTAREKDVIELERSDYSRGALAIDEDVLLRTLRQVLEPIVVSCEVTKIKKFYGSFVRRIESTDKYRGESYTDVSKVWPCGDQKFKYF